RGWDGTGNWAFNTAFAGSVPGIRAYVARLWNIEQLESWIAREIPVVCSVSYDLLKGKGQKGKSDGHLVVLVGFTAEGNPVFNDPGRNAVRMTYNRQDFELAWRSSGNTCYMIYPKLYAPPENRERCWVD
ncbi:MAG: C39 family peptidase, partial [Fimbriimonadaceae bacterium]